MKKVLLSIVILATLVQAENIVKYDTKEVKEAEMSKPNYPNSDLYTKK